MASKGQKFRKWSKEEKLEIVHKHLDEHLSVRQLEKNYGANSSMICHWVKAFAQDGDDAFNSKRVGNPFAALHTSKSLSEVEKLKLIVAKQEIEIERLKKGYFVKGVGASKVFVTSKDKNIK